MDQIAIGCFIAKMRKERGLKQRELADLLSISDKTVSKWETGHGFPDVSTLSALADILGVNERILLLGDLKQNNKEAGNMKRTKFYVCETCGSILYGTGNCVISCCGKQLQPLKATQADENHALTISDVEDEYYLEFSHEMSKEHFISFIAYVGFDRVMTVRLYPEQDAALRFPRMYGGRFYYYCNQHGLFEYKR